ncbi:MAG: hypothetical protein GTO14_19550 [Anaerolineales bacterium]|nr:hypothetical protein [Anaerolineales bacterium]
MFRREKLPTMTLFMILVLALAAMGVGYGLWFKILYVEGTVATGFLDAELSIKDVIETERKDVGWCEPSLMRRNQDKDTLFIQLGNTYPSYDCRVIFDVHNTGSIPIHIYRPYWVAQPPASAVTVEFEPCYPDDFQLHPSEEAICEVYIHVEQGAAQNGEYRFEAEIEVRQYNEPRIP